MKFSHLVIIALVILLGCIQNNSEPNYPIIPYIEYRNLEFHRGKASPYTTPDTLKLSFYLRDGDFDLGLSESDSLLPYNYLFLFDKSQSKFVATNRFPKDISNLLKYSDKKPLDTLPSITSNAACSRWTLYIDKDGIVTDTLYTLLNENRYNIIPKIYVQTGTNPEYEFDPLTYFTFPNCTPNLLMGIFGPLNRPQSGPFEYQPITSKEGKFTYSLTSYAFRILFGTRKIRIKFFIRDRALHTSNIVETPQIQL